MPVVGVAPTVVGAGAECKDVGAEGISYLEVVGDGIDVCIDGGFCGGGGGDAAIADNFPSCGGGDGEVDGGFEVRLVEAGEDAFGVGGFALAVEVDGSVGGVYGAV